MGIILSKAEVEYKLHHTLDGHTKAINALGFSPDGKFLASAASDSKLRIWSTRTGKCSQTISNTVNGPVTDVVWATNKQACQGIIFACADGTVHTYVRASNSYFEGVVVTCAHGMAIEGIDFDTVYKRVATAGGGEVKVWNINPDWTMDLYASVARPDAVISRTVHFFNKGQSLIATYLESSKIVAWNVDPWNKLWDGQTQCRIGHAALSPDGRHMLVHNFKDGTDGYTVPNMFRLAVFHVPVSVSRPKQVTFDASGTLVIQGSDKGLVYISDFDNTVVVQTLVHTPVRDAFVPVVTSHSYKDQYWIATGCASEVPIVKIWKRKHIVPDEVYGGVILASLVLIYALRLRVFGLWEQWLHTAARVAERAGVVSGSWYST